MKREILFISLALITIGLIMISSSIAKAQNADEFVVPLSDPSKKGKLKAHLNYGSITVKGTNRKDVLVRYKIVQDDDHDHDDRKNSGNRAGLRKIGGGGMDLEAIESNNYVKVQSDSWNNRMDLEIEVPSNMDMEVHTYNDGDLMITNIQGDLSLTNYNGEITALNISGSVIATTYNGEIKITFDKVTENSPMSFSTYNGDIDLTLPSTLKSSFKMKTEQGEIYTDFDMKITSTGPVKLTDERANVKRIKIDDWKRGDINGGGAEITMKNYNGDILIRKK